MFATLSQRYNIEQNSFFYFMKSCDAVKQQQNVSAATRCLLSVSSLTAFTRKTTVSDERLIDAGRKKSGRKELKISEQKFAPARNTANF